MNACDFKLLQALNRLNHCQIIEGAQSIATTCLLPDGEVVNVYVYKSTQGRYVVTDGGNAITFLTSYGLKLNGSITKSANNFAEKYYMEYSPEQAHFSSHSCELDEVAANVIYLANLVSDFTRDAYQKCFETFKDDFKNEIIDALYSQSVNKNLITENYTIAGSSNKKFTYDCAILKGDMAILLEGVTNHPNSVASAYVKFDDSLNSISDKKLFGEVVIRNASEWAASDISLLQSAANNVNFIEDRLKPLVNRYSLAA